ncbi:MAG: S-layer homology domain-containing protein [Desulfitobacteriaceae bacterium]|nr:S-layer homology domain-containing protein [Desulfitobacteriaceae bacterium]MDD4753443.1 S-layer homology domain-containing protein [Desulfitobacteriaceae bacterium]
MLKNKLIGITLSGAILLMGSSIAFADTVDVNIPSDEIIPISVPVNEDSSKAFETKFTDIEGHWAYDEIVSLEEMGMWGDLSGEFSPQEMVTGTEFYAYLDKIFEFEAEVDLGFELEEEVSRMEAAKAIKKSFEAKKLSVIMTQMFPIYEDTKNLAQEETSALSFVFNTGIMKGRTEGKFCPDDSIKRAELGVILNRTLTTLENASPIE